MHDRPRYLYRKSSTGESYPVRPIWHREWYPIKKHYRVLDCENAYDYDDYYKLEFTVAHGFFEYIRPDERQKLNTIKRARAKAEAIVREIEWYKLARDWRKQLQRTTREFEFVFEPYRQALVKQYGPRWREDMPIVLNARAVRKMRLARISPEKQRPRPEVRVPVLHLELTQPQPVPVAQLVPHDMDIVRQAAIHGSLTSTTRQVKQAIAVARQAAIQGVTLKDDEWKWWREFIAKHEGEIEEELQANAVRRTKYITTA